MKQGGPIGQRWILKVCCVLKQILFDLLVFLMDSKLFLLQDVRVSLHATSLQKLETVLVGEADKSHQSAHFCLLRSSRFYYHRIILRMVYFLQTWKGWPRWHQRRFFSSKCTTFWKLLFMSRMWPGCSSNLHSGAVMNFETSPSALHPANYNGSLQSRRTALNRSLLVPWTLCRKVMICSVWK